MADSLILNGVKEVKKHTGKELLLTRPKRGGDTHKIKEWWHGTNGVQYVDCTIFDVTAKGERMKLAVASTNGTFVRIDHDGELNFAFYASRNVTRAALFTQDLQLVEHYVLPSMSGGKVMTVKPHGAVTKPIFAIKDVVTAPTPPKTKSSKKVVTKEYKSAIKKED
tara:strand:- start:171 stop:668 length:498 start_codon:yes stop_codon:yes gene_type:complete